MDKIWSPWRSKYVKLTKIKGCIFCQAYKCSQDKKNYVIYKNKSAFVIMNIFPYNNGHLMVAPKNHTGNLMKLKDDEMLEIIRLIKESCRTLKKVLKPRAFNIGLNFGREAGAGIEDHLHFHIVPRWRGDTNFMPVIADTKVIPQSLNELYQILKKEFDEKKTA